MREINLSFLLKFSKYFSKYISVVFVIVKSSVDWILIDVSFLEMDENNARTFLILKYIRIYILY